MKEMAAPKLTVKELERLLSVDSPKLFNAESGMAIEDLWYGGCRMRRHFHPRSLRSGGTVSGPTMMALADFAVYVALLGAIGWVPEAVTSHFTIDFLKKPAPRDLLAEVHLIKIGKRMVVGAVAIRSDGDEELVAHATCTYVMPRER